MPRRLRLRADELDYRPTEHLERHDLRPRSQLLIPLLVGLAACSGRDDAEVPPRNFGGGSSSATISSGAAEPAFRAIEGRPLPERTATTTLDGAAIGYGGLSIRGVVEFDVDGDSDPDALLALASDHELAVGFARREPDRFVQSIVSRRELPAGCTIDTVGLRVVARDLAFVSNRLRCDAAPRVLVDVVRLGAVVRPGFGYSVDPPLESDPFVASVTVVPRPDDVDDDGSTDVVLDVETTDRASGSRHTENVVAHATASGFAIDFAAVVARATVLARSATRDLARKPARALRDASAGLDFVRSVCSDAPAPSLRFREDAGRCGDRASPARFVGTIAVAFAKLGRIDDLGRMLDTIESASIALDDASRNALVAALRASANRTVPSYREVTLPSSVAPTMSWAFDANGALVATGVPSGTLVLDPEPTFTVDPAAVPVSGARTRRFDDSFLIEQGGHTRIVATPALDGGSIRDCIASADGRVVLCRGDGILRIAHLDGAP